MADILRVEGLSVRYRTVQGDGYINAVNGVNFSLREEAIFCLVGESGSGKSTTALALLGLLPSGGEVTGGTVHFQGQDLLRIPHSSLRQISGKDISMVFQDPRASLNPTLAVGDQIEEAVINHTGMLKREARRLAEDALREMGLPDAPLALNRYPFQLSGGMCQRVMLAMALILHPTVLIADEPTSNLDVTLQAQILERLKSHCKEMHCTVLLITHDMGVVAQMADEVAVMYGGSIVEQADVDSFFRRQYHPYTWGIFQSMPRLDMVGRRLEPLRGIPPDLLNLPDQCPYVPRCPKATSQCRTEPNPRLSTIEDGHLVACYNPVDYSWVEETTE